MSKTLAIYWSRRDFRLTDNQALSRAASFAKESKGQVLPLFVLEDYMKKDDFPAPARHVLSHALPLFFEQYVHSLVLEGKGARTINLVVKKFEQEGYDVHVFVNEDVYPDFYIQIEKIKKNNISIEVCTDRISVSKETKTGAGNIYSIFTPFKNAVWGEFVSREPLPRVDPKKIPYFEKPEKLFLHAIPCNGAELEKLFSKKRNFTAGGAQHDIDSQIDEAQDLSAWYMSEDEALKGFKAFLEKNVDEYKNKRDFLATEGTSKMSLALAWGFVSAGTLCSCIKTHYNASFDNPHSLRHEGATHYISELIWREFYGYLLYHYPHLMHTEFQEKFRGKIRWQENKEGHRRFALWMRGETGYVIVDAAMKQLAKCGWMHNRARMIVSSVLTKNLGVDWRWGQEYFRAMLIDLDEASNNGGWQWGASVGADPKPIRIFNPYLQAKNYDADSAYQKKWLPSERLVLQLPPLVEHKDAREDALTRYGLSEKGGVRYF